MACGENSLENYRLSESELMKMPRRLETMKVIDLLSDKRIKVRLPRPSDREKGPQITSCMTGAARSNTAWGDGRFRPEPPVVTVGFAQLPYLTRDTLRPLRIPEPRCFAASTEFCILAI
jgi:hypothetical protein